MNIYGSFTLASRIEANKELGIVARDAEDRYDLDTVFGKFIVTSQYIIIEILSVKSF